MSDTSVTADISQSSDVLGDLPSKLASHDVIAVNNLSDAAKLVFAQFAGLGDFVNFAFF
jgi:hypothetical protein